MTIEEKLENIVTVIFENGSEGKPYAEGQPWDEYLKEQIQWIKDFLELKKLTKDQS